MPGYRFSAVDASGSPETGTVKAADQAIALQELIARGLVVYELEDAAKLPAKPWYAQDLKLFGRRADYADTADLCEILASLSQAGVPQLDAIRMAQRTISNRSIRSFLNAAEYNLLDGRPIHDTLSTQDFGFPSLFSTLFGIAEQSNSMASVLSDAAQFFRAQSKTTANIKSALIYPAMLGVVGMLVLFLLIFFLAPNLAPLFEATEKSTPPTLAFLLSIRDLLSTVAPGLVIAGPLVVTASLAAAGSPNGRRFISSLAIRTPILGSSLLDIQASQIAKGLSVMLDAGLRLPSALDELSTAFKNSPLSGPLADAAQAVREGASAHGPIQSSSRFPLLFSELFKIAEQTNQIPSMMRAAADTLAQSGRRKLDRLVELLPPLLTLILGAGIASLVYLVFGTIMDINDSYF